MLQAAINFFNDHGVNPATDAIDKLLFSEPVSLHVFGALFDYRIALTILSRWKGQEVVNNTVFAGLKVCNYIIHCIIYIVI